MQYPCLSNCAPRNAAGLTSPSNFFDVEGGLLVLPLGTSDVDFLGGADRDRADLRLVSTSSSLMGFLDWAVEERPLLSRSTGRTCLHMTAAKLCLKVTIVDFYVGKIL